MAKKITDENGNTYVQKKPFYKKIWFWVLAIIIVIGIVGSLGDSSDNDTSTKKESSSVSQKHNNHQQILNKIVNDTNLGDSTLTYDEYENLTVDRYTLKAALMKYGAPKYAEGGDKGDIQMDLVWPTNEDGYSAELIFKHDKNAPYSDWVLKEKNSVKNSGINISKYENEK